MMIQKSVAKQNYLNFLFVTYLAFKQKVKFNTRGLIAESRVSASTVCIMLRIGIIERINNETMVWKATDNPSAEMAEKLMSAISEYTLNLKIKRINEYKAESLQYKPGPKLLSAMGSSDTKANNPLIYTDEEKISFLVKTVADMDFEMKAMHQSINRIIAYWLPSENGK